MATKIFLKEDSPRKTYRGRRTRRTRAACFRRISEVVTGGAKVAKVSPHMVIKFVESAAAAPSIAARVKEDISALREERVAKKSAKKQAKPVHATAAA